MIAPEAAKMTSGASATNSAAYMRKQSASPTPQRALAVSGRPTECRLMAEADITSKKGGFSFCEGFRMPAAPNAAAHSGGRRTKTCKGGNRDLGTLAGRRGDFLVAAVEGGKRSARNPIVLLARC